MRTKVCQKCKQEKEISEFSTATYKRGGVSKRCTSCKASATHNEADSASQQEKNIIVSRMLHGAQRRAKQKGLEFDLTSEDIELPDVCPILGIELKKNVGVSGDNSYSLDRKDSSKGYVKGNVHVISHRANTLKCNATLKELKNIVEWMEINER